MEMNYSSTINFKLLLKFEEKNKKFFVIKSEYNLIKIL